MPERHTACQGPLSWPDCSLRRPPERDELGPTTSPRRDGERVDDEITHAFAHECGHSGIRHGGCIGREPVETVLGDARLVVETRATVRHHLTRLISSVVEAALGRS